LLSPSAETTSRTSVYDFMPGDKDILTQQKTKAIVNSNYL